MQPVLKEEQLAVRTQHAPQLVQCKREVRNRAEGEEREDRVDTVIVERDTLGGSAEQFDGERHLLGSTRRLFYHLGMRVESVHIVNAVGIIQPEYPARSDANLQDSATRAVRLGLYECVHFGVLAEAPRQLLNMGVEKPSVETHNSMLLPRRRHLNSGGLSGARRKYHFSRQRNNLRAWRDVLCRNCPEQLF